MIILLYQVHLKPLTVRFKAIRLSELGLCSYKYLNVAFIVLICICGIYFFHIYCFDIYMWYLWQA